MFRNYFKIAFKVFMRRKFFTLISLFGIGVTLTVVIVATAFLDHVFGDLPPENKAGRTLKVLRMGWLTVTDRGENGSDGIPSYYFLDRYVRTLPDVEKVSIYSAISKTVLPAAAFKNGQRIELHLKHTDGAFWEILEFDFLEGGPFTARDDRDANLVAVINAATRRRFFGETSALGQMIEVDGQRFRVVGVVANVPIYRITPFADVWVPIGSSKSNRYLTRQKPTGEFEAIVQARGVADLPGIRAEFKRRLSRAHLDFPDPTGGTRRLYSGLETTFQAFSRMIFETRRFEQGSEPLLGYIAGLMVLFMVLPAVNLVNLNVSRGLERASEIGVRKAFGASSRVLIGQFVVENVLITLVGGLAGLGVSVWVLQMVEGTGFLVYADFDINLRIAGYALLGTVFFGVFSGVYPAWKMSKMNPVEALRGRTQ